MIFESEDYHYMHCLQSSAAAFGPVFPGLASICRDSTLRTPTHAVSCCE